MRQRARAAAGRLTAFVLVVGLAPFGCGDSEGGATLGYVTSGCKSKSAGTGQSLTVEGGEAYQGLTCVAWEHPPGEEDRTRFSLYNFRGGCGAQYQGEAFVSDGGAAIALSLTNPSGAVAACGWCIYDFSFDVKGVARGRDLLVTVERSNSSRRAEEETTTVALGAQERPQGIVCRYADRSAIGWHASQTGTIGKRNMPCESLLGTPGPGCDPGLTCTAVDATGEHRLCLASCTADPDCGDQALFTCAQSVCQLRAPG